MNTHICKGATFCVNLRVLSFPPCCRHMYVCQPFGLFLPAVAPPPPFGFLKVKREGLEVFAELGPEVGTYWIKFDLSIYQICLMSPRSGPHRYIYDKESG